MELGYAIGIVTLVRENGFQVWLCILGFRKTFLIHYESPYSEALEGKGMASPGEVGHSSSLDEPFAYADVSFLLEKLWHLILSLERSLCG